MAKGDEAQNLDCQIKRKAEDGKAKVSSAARPRCSGRS